MKNLRALDGHIFAEAKDVFFDRKKLEESICSYERNLDENFKIQNARYGVEGKYLLINVR